MRRIQKGSSDPQLCSACCGSLLPFWMRRIDLREGHRRLEEALAATPERTPTRAAALLAASAMDFRSGDLACAARHAREGYEIAAALDDPRTQWQAPQPLAGGCSGPG